MAEVQDHYDQHLGPVYSWMAGGIDPALERGAAELNALGVTPLNTGLAVDLGAGFGMHAIPLARRGVNVLAIDMCTTLLDELRAQQGGLPIQVVQDDLQSFHKYLSERPELILCMGDTLTHLADESSVERLIATISDELSPGGRFVASFRDYSNALAAEQRFIPVRSDETRILTCFLEYTVSHVTVHDILHEWNGSNWKLSVSSYQKLRISLEWLKKALRENGFTVDCDTGPSGMIRFVARRV